MKQDIHPTYHSDCKVTCACGNSFETGSTKESIHVELCSACHPFYTGQQKFVDTAQRVNKFKERLQKQEALSKTTKKKDKKKKTDEQEASA